ncbi:hypothetical protein EJB05_54035, partial [Eragrostis curvula]
MGSPDEEMGPASVSLTRLPHGYLLNPHQNRWLNNISISTLPSPPAAAAAAMASRRCFLRLLSSRLIGSHQFKVSNGDSIFTERLKFCDVNDKLILNRVLMLGSQTQTVIGRPTLPDAAVHAVVEEHALDAKVIIFKKKRRKNYRRTKGHRQELTKLRITNIEGIDKPETVAVAA